jgi:hypothetical protein
VQLRLTSVLCPEATLGNPLFFGLLTRHELNYHQFHRNEGVLIVAIKRLDKKDWAVYFDGISKTLGTKKVSVEVAPLGIGREIEATYLALGGLVYDRKSDLFEVQTAELDHLIHGPTTIFVDESATGITSVEVIDRDGTKQLIILSEPLPSAPVRD